MNLKTFPFFIIIIIIGIYIAPFPFIKCSKALHIVIVYDLIPFIYTSVPLVESFRTISHSSGCTVH